MIAAILMLAICHGENNCSQGKLADFYQGDAGVKTCRATATALNEAPKGAGNPVVFFCEVPKK